MLFCRKYVGEEALAAINLGLGLCIGVAGSVICGILCGVKADEKEGKGIDI